jgi:hypothetical protein
MDDQGTDENFEGCDWMSGFRFPTQARTFYFGIAFTTDLELIHYLGHTVRRNFSRGEGVNLPDLAECTELYLRSPYMLCLTSVC